MLYVNIIVCSLLFQLVSELVRVATPGATIIILTWCHRDLSPSEESLKPEEKKLLKKICDAYYLKTCSLANYVQLFESFSLQIHIFIFQALLYWSCYTLPLFLNCHPLWFWIILSKSKIVHKCLLLYHPNCPFSFGWKSWNWICFLYLTCPFNFQLRMIIYNHIVIQKIY